jgi:hypothetical protein
MPHKRNPPTCETIVAISKILRSTAPLALEAMMTEHERDKVGLQTEREFISRACCLADAEAKKSGCRRGRPDREAAKHGAQFMAPAAMVVLMVTQMRARRAAGIFGSITR